MEKFPYTPNHTIQPSKKFGSKFGSIIVSFFLGAILIYCLFPRETILEKIVEKPVEKIVEKIVEVPAKLTKEQKQAVLTYIKILETGKHQIGRSDKAVYPAQDNEIQIIVVGEDSTFRNISKSEIESRVESVFRRNGFKIANTDSKNLNTYIVVYPHLMLSDNRITLSGVLSISIHQHVLGFSGSIWKQTHVATNLYEQNISYGRDNFHEIPALFDSLAIKASNDLNKAGQTPLLNQ